MLAEPGIRERPLDKWRTRLASIKLRILLADDDARIRALWSALLVDVVPDAHLIEAGDGQSAVWMAQELQPHVIVMDIVMPRMGGLDATRHLKTERETADIPVIAVTGSACSVQDVIAAGCSGLVTKPFGPERLLEEIVRVLWLPKN